MADPINQRLKELKIDLPETPNPVANYLPYTITGNLVFISGQIPFVEGQLLYSGKIGEDISIEDGQKAARICGLNLLSQLNQACDQSLNRVSRVIKIGGFVNSTSIFKEHALVINGVSNLMVEVFQDRGKHARAAIGCSSLPLGASVEVEAIFEIK
jgi:enamine deaminase RidA (YjgF/YER057c/UK114 family)